MRQKTSALGRFLADLGPPATFVALLGLAWLILLTINIWTNNDRLLWDTWVSFFAMKAWNEGSNPYAYGLVPAGTAKYTHYLFPYPPLTLFLFSPLAYIGENFPYVFYVFKLGLLGGLIWLWKRYFLGKGEAAAGLLLFIIIAYGGATEIDLWVGNVTVLEQALLWVGFAGFVTGNLGVFVAGVCAASLWKLNPIVFLWLLPFSRQPHKWRWFAIGCGVFILIFPATYLFWPEQMKAFMTNATTTLAGQPGRISPSCYTVFRDLFDDAGLPRELNSSACAIVYVPYALTVLLSLRLLFLRAARLPELEARKVTVCLAILAYYLLMPRIKDYTYIGMIFPSYYIIRRVKLRSTFPLLFVIFAFLPDPHTDVDHVGFDRVFDFIRTFYPFGLTLLTWDLYRRHLRPSAAPVVNEDG